MDLGRNLTRSPGAWVLSASVDTDTSKGVTGLECCKTRGFTKPNESALSTLPQSDIGERLSKVLAFS